MTIAQIRRYHRKGQKRTSNKFRDKLEILVTRMLMSI